MDFAVNDSTTDVKPRALEPGREKRELEVQVERRVRQIESQVRARPIMTVALAVISGFIVARMFRD